MPSVQRGFVATIVMAGVLAGPATAAPWDAGLNVTSEGEAAFGAIASEIAGVPSTVRCWSPDEWNANPYGGPGIQGYVFIGSGVTDLSPNVCELLDAFRLVNPKPACVADRYETYSYRVRAWRWKYVRRHGKRVRVRYRTWVNVTRTRTVPGDPFFCGFPTAGVTSRAAQTFAHESIHLRGITDEATAECYGRQLAKTVLLRLGAPNAGYAFELGRYALAVGLPPEYYSPECRDGGTLDLNPGSTEWP